MRCVFGTASVPAYWRAANEVACVIDPSKAIAPAKYDVKFFFTAATTGGVSVGGQVDVVDGAALCGAAATCGVCDKTACVYCADGARQCVPGTALGGPVGVCSNWFSRSCPDFVLSLDGAPQRANILAGNTHTYSFTVPAGTQGGRARRRALVSARGADEQRGVAADAPRPGADDHRLEQRRAGRHVGLCQSDRQGAARRLSAAAVRVSARARTT
jgi:hypothetical protein